MRKALVSNHLRCLALVLMVLAASGAFAASDGASATVNADVIPPLTLKGYDEATLHPIPQETVESYLTRVPIVHTFNAYEGQNAELEQETEGAGVTVLSAGYSVDLPSAELFDGSFADGQYNVYLAGIASLDAQALRLLVDLSALGEGDEVWVIDPVEPRAFGPFLSLDAEEGGRWLPTTESGMTVLMIRSTSTEMPEIRLLAISHFFREVTPLKLLSCNVNIACESSSTVQTLSAGVGYMIIPYGSYGMAQCTGTLISNPNTTTIEPYLLTSDHCIEDNNDPTEIEVVWDYRAASCGSTSAPSLSSLPRSYGKRLLKTSSTLDITLLLLDDVPNGSYGRAWLAWNNSALSAGQNVIAIHFPENSHMRISTGTIVAPSQLQNGFPYQIKVHWDEGVTEPGSSGSALLLVDAGYQIIGTLSSGTEHSCSSNTNNYDWFSSFRQFLPTVEEYLSGTNPPLDGDGTTTTCAFSEAYKNNAELLKQFRALRDKGLLKSDFGRSLVSAYYKVAPSLASLLEQSPTAKDLFIAVTVPFAKMGQSDE